MSMHPGMPTDEQQDSAAEEFYAPADGKRERERAIRACKEIAWDMERDATNFDGQPFNGRTVAEYFGNQGAAIAALAGIVRLLLEADTTK